MYTKWTAHLKDEHAKAQFELDIRRAKPVLERLQTIIEQEIDAYENQYGFESPAWPYQQAATLGAKRSLKYVKQLIDLDQQKDTNE